MKPHERLEQIRCSLNKPPGEVAEQAGVSRAAYYDLESDPTEIFMSISLRDLQRICDCLGVDAFYLFTGANRSESDACYDFEPIAGLIREHLKRSGQSAVEFSDRVGWELEPFLADLSSGWCWNLDCLLDMCVALGIPWEMGLPTAAPTT
ncbi:MAG TPA: helix-turn-helix transcriptional regulator [Tepidisphaeraceae bacterium]|nr:helix-turn-helix transcriptional regulator [Tepidisphaeraceae bacterium]